MELLLIHQRTLYQASYSKTLQRQIDGEMRTGNPWIWGW